MGWESAFKDLQTDAKHFSLIFGLIFIFVIFSERIMVLLRFFTLIFLMICTLIHARYGLAFFSLMVLYYVSLNKFNSLKLIIFYFGLGFLLPSIILLNFHGKS